MSYELMLDIEEEFPRSLGTFDSYDEADAARNLLVSKANSAGWVIYDCQDIFVEEELFVKERPKIVFDENLILTPPDDWRAY
jgi:hypothetical protein